VAGDRGRTDERHRATRVIEEGVDRSRVPIDHGEHPLGSPLSPQLIDQDRRGGIALGGFRMNVLPQAMATGYIHIGTITGS